MSKIEYIHTDLALNKLKYMADEILGDHRAGRVICADGSPPEGIIFSEVPPRRSEAKWNLPFLELKRYMVTHCAASFEYGKSGPFREEDRRSSEWFLNFIRGHLRNGAKKFYYAKLWEGYDPDEKNPKMKKIDLATFKPGEKGFGFGQHTIWEFVDSSIGP